MKENGALVGGLCLLGIALIAAWYLIGGLLIMVAWNALAPLWGGPVLAYWQGVAAAVLLSVVGGAFKSNVTTTK